MGTTPQPLPYSSLIAPAFTVTIPTKCIFPPGKLIPGHDILLAVFVTALIVPLADADGLAIYDTINSLRCEVRTICVGLAASMGAFLLSSGSKGMRCALPNSEILIHQPLGGAQGQASDIIIAAKHIERTRRTLNTVLALNTGKTVEQIAVDTDRDNTMTAEEAVRYGLVDRVLVPDRIKAKE